jgi:glycosyltransferase involved in cell wall biosynthesis
MEYARVRAIRGEYGATKKSSRRMRNVLVISYLFPPIGGVGVPRTVAYSRYLPRQNCRTFVLTVSRLATAHQDRELEKLVPGETVVYRAFNPELPYRLKDKLWRRLSGRQADQPVSGAPVRNRERLERARSAVRSAIANIAFPDVQSAWFPFALAKAARIIRRHDIDTIIVVAPPYSLLRIGVALKRRFAHLKLITDLRDDWLGYYVSQTEGPSDYSLGWSARQWNRARELERSAFMSSALVSITTPAWVDDLRARYRDIAPEKFICTTNGYEPEMFPQPFAGPHGTDEPIRIAYLGTLNASPVYSPGNFLTAFDGLPENVRRQYEVQIIGRVTPECRAMLKGRREIREFGFVEKLRGIELLRHAELLLLIATNPKSHAGKFFEYLATGIPILALSPPGGEVARILRETGSGWSVDPWDIDAIRTNLLDLPVRIRSEQPIIHPNWNVIHEYSWPQIVRRLASTIRQAKQDSATAAPLIPVSS